MTRPTRRLLRATLILVLLAPAGGCAAARIRPWDRDLLAEKKMQFVPCPMLHAVDQHIYFSKEGSTGGADVSGGGCGCN
ncbi:MAG TPA: DUF4266 domain-containing protein [Candidatus Polarisedimenticolia bacterium]|nr:DUF4266 domain-containing protein [Candidatus Polarisedimenticolia bacterium]